MHVTAAHDVLRVVDCVTPGCIAEAETGRDYCARHEPARRVVSVAATNCRIPGCENPPREGAPSRGPHANLCDEHRKRASGEQSARQARSSSPAPAPQPESRPEPAATPSPGVDGFEARAQRLVDAGRRLDEARLALDAAQTEWDAARAALEA